MAEVRGEPVTGDSVEEKRLRSALDFATTALRDHRADMHLPSNRPCRTCLQGGRALAFADMVRNWHDDRRAARNASPSQGAQ